MHCAQAPQTQPKHICQSSSRKLQERGHWRILGIAIWVFLQELFQGHVSIGRMACRVELHFWWLVQATWTVSLCQFASNGSNSWDNKWKERPALLYQAREGTDSQISKMNKWWKNLNKATQHDYRRNDTGSYQFADWTIVVDVSRRKQGINDQWSIEILTK